MHGIDPPPDRIAGSRFSKLITGLITGREPALAAAHRAGVAVVVEEPLANGRQPRSDGTEAV
jgi:hypothetical protein